MLYDLTEYLGRLGVDIPGMGLFGYLSFRAIAAFTLALLISIFAGRRIIAWLQKKQIGETIRDLGLEGQMQKKGTPTMGGVIIFISLIIPVLLLGDLRNIYNILLIISTVWFFLIGFADDYIKVFKKNKEGMSEKGKLVAQGLMALSIGLAVCFSDQIVIREDVATDGSAITAVEQADATVPVETEKVDIVKSTKTTLPFVKNHEFDYSWLSPFKGAWGRYCKWAIYVLMIVIVITACSNGVNLTDGMDGLAAGTSAIVGVVLGIFAWLGGNIVNADYLNIMYIPGSGEVAVFMSALVGALIGFLWYNTFPAQVFMGDTGSLMLGGIIGVTAVLIRKELLIPILCGVFFAESVSVLMQRFYFKYTKKKYGEGRRIFRMAPLHHHYQKDNIPALIQRPAKALPEAKIVSRFWIVGIILALVTVALLKVR
ncbi:MAG: phospho-N-acetylmuramoyl-pentapeptide-transferase [Bacteroidales bacterium]|nr:phospho-N-acetylmuramoyl-pentapeptide-transferase [Bacteroidales bacterium]